MAKLVEEIKSCIPKDVFTEKELKLAFPTATSASRHNKLTRAVAEGHLIRLKRGVYYLAKPYQREGLNLFEISCHLYFPSYISLESALAHYQLIPEAVYTTTAITPKQTQTIETPLGTFSYTHLPPKLFNEGFQRIKTDTHVFMMANPLKALLDYTYVKRKYFSALTDLEKDLRIDLNELKKKVEYIPNKQIKNYSTLYSNKNVNNLIELIIWELL